MATLVLRSNPREECSFVNQTPAADALYYLMEAVLTPVENQVTKSAERRPGLILTPLGSWDQALRNSIT
jgi:hypothetical protein